MWRYSVMPPAQKIPRIPLEFTQPDTKLLALEKQYIISLMFPFDRTSRTQIWNELKTFAVKYDVDFPKSAELWDYGKCDAVFGEIKGKVLKKIDKDLTAKSERDAKVMQKTLGMSIEFGEKE